MKLGRTLLTAPKLIGALAFILSTSACNVTPPSAANSPAATQPATTSPAVESTAMPLPTLPAGRTPRQVETPITVVMTTTHEPIKMGQQPALVFQWRGGLVGRNDLWTIYASGTIRNNKDQEFTVSPESVTALMDQLEKLGFYNLKDRYEVACDDCFEYTIYAYKANVRKTIYAIDNGALPEPLMQAVKAIQEIVAPTK